MTYKVIATVRCNTSDEAERIASSLHTAESGAIVQVFENPNDPQTRTIVCVDDGVIYPSAADACRELQLDEGNMSKHLRGKLRTIAGKRFRYT